MCMASAAHRYPVRDEIPVMLIGRGRETLIDLDDLAALERLDSEGVLATSSVLHSMPPRVGDRRGDDVAPGADGGRSIVVSGWAGSGIGATSFNPLWSRGSRSRSA